METHIMTEIQTEIKEIKDAWNEYKEELSSAKAEIKAILKQTWIDMKFEYAKAKAEVQLEEHQKVIDKLAIQAQLKIDELKHKHTHLR